MTEVGLALIRTVKTLGRRRVWLLLLGVTLALLTHLPVVGLLTPNLAALAYVHYCLEALRGLRQGAVVTVIGELPTVKEAI